jgi:hypothetical protein
VRAHLFPRALQHDIRRGAKHLVRVGFDDPRPRPSQSGDWRDDILCAEHEAALGEADRYGIEFARSYGERGTLFASGKAVLVANERPDLLRRFIHAVVWRHTAALIAGGGVHWLGPYHDRIGEVLFKGRYPLEGYIIDPSYHSQGQPTQVGLNPCPALMGNLRLTRFDIGGLGFHLKTDARPFPQFMARTALHHDPLLVVTFEPTEISADPHFRAIAAAAAGTGRLGGPWRDS